MSSTLHNKDYGQKTAPADDRGTVMSSTAEPPRFGLDYLSSGLAPP